ncbi:MAG: hypothetical protein GX579_01175 [Chloroflexi bacterium]|nr:hypothetical protein [Chloroflexota bacterium]
MAEKQPEREPRPDYDPELDDDLDYTDTVPTQRGAAAGDGDRPKRQYTSNDPQPQSEQHALLYTEGEEKPDYPLGGQREFDRLTTEENSEGVMTEIGRETEDADILDDFQERQTMPTDEQGLFRRLREHHAETPELSGGDLDEGWFEAGVGDHDVGAEPMPDRDLVDEIGEGAGVTYRDDEELDFATKVLRRDEERWELDPASAEDELDEDEPDVEE